MTKAVWITCVLSVAAQASGQLEYRTLAFSGQQAPGAPAGVTFITGFGLPTINNGSGDVAFLGTLTGPGVGSQNNIGIYSGGPGSIAQSVCAGDAVPDAPGVSLSGPLTIPTISDSGKVVFSSLLTGAGVTGANDSGIYANDAGVVSAVVRKGDAAPGAGAGVSFALLDDFVLAGDDRIALLGILTGAGVTTTNDLAVFGGTTGSLTLAAREGDPVPGVPGAVYLTPSNVRVNASGTVAFQAFLTGGGVGSSNDLFVFAGPPGSVAPVIREGNLIPGLPAGTVLFGMISLGLDDAGRVIQFVSLAGPSIDSSNNGAYLATSGGTTAALIREGDPAPGTGAGITLSMDTPYIDNSGKLAFVAGLLGPGVTGANDNALFAGAGPFTLIAREGDSVPGHPGVLIGSINNQPRVNAQGDVAFIADVTGAGVNSGNDRALFLKRGGTLHVVAREGDAFDVDDSGPGVDLRNVGSIALSISNNPGMLRSTLSDTGELAFTIIFGDSSMGVFLITSGAVPCTADTNNDGILSPADFSAWIAAFNASAPECDQNADGLCTPADFSAWIANYNTGC